MNVQALQIREEGNAIVRDIARREPAKIVAQSASISPRHVYNLREEIGQPDLSWWSFLLLAMNDPDLRQFVLKRLDAAVAELDAKRAARAPEFVGALDQLFRLCLREDETGEAARKVYKHFFETQNDAPAEAAE